MAKNFPLFLNMFKRLLILVCFIVIYNVFHHNITLMSGRNNLMVQKYSENINDGTQKNVLTFYGPTIEVSFWECSSYLDLALGTYGGDLSFQYMRLLLLYM